MKLTTRAALLAASLGGALVSREARAQRRVLVYTGRTEDTFNMTRAAEMLRAQADLASGPARPEFSFADEARWRSLTRADFASYHALWIDAANCALSSPDRAAPAYTAVEETRDVWSPAITGHFEISGSDSDLHIATSEGARRFVVNSYHYVTSGAGTGLFASVGCIFFNSPANTPVPWLQGIGDFRVTGDGCTDGQVLEPAAARHPVHIGINPPATTLQLPQDLAWGCFTHSHFNRHPPSFQRVYSIGSGEGSGVIIVNDRGGCVVDADCVMGEYCNRDPRGGDPTCRPTLGLGRACRVDSQCTSGVCAQGVCCDRRCDGACERCSLAATQGLCAPLPAGSRPTLVCVCDGRSPACVPPDAGTPDAPVDVTPDIAPDVSPDVAPDVSPDVSSDVSPDAVTGDVCEGWRCGRELRLDGRAGPLGGCGCSVPESSSRSSRAFALACVAAFVARRRRARRV